MEPDLDFLSWYFTFMDSEAITCPHCRAKIDREEAEEISTSENFLTCPYCNENISRDDIDI